MKNSSIIFLKIQLLSLFGINEIKHSNDKKEKRSLLILAMGILITGLLIGGYCLFTAMVLEATGMAEVIPVYMLTTTSLIVIVLTIFKTDGIIFAFKDYDMLMSFPVKTSSIVISRFLIVYILNLMISLLVTIPMGIVYGLFVAQSYIYILMMIISILIIPLIPMVIAFTIGAIIVIVSSRLRHKDLVVTILSFMLVFGVIYLNIIYLRKIGMDDVAMISASLVEQIYSIYPIAEIYAIAILNNDIIYFIMFISTSMILFYTFVKLVSWKYCEINTNIAANVTKNNYQLNELHISSPFLALYKKELKRYITSSIYILNTSIGVVLLFIMMILIGIFGIDAIGIWADMPRLATLISSGGPMIISWMLIMSCTTSSAISLEGKSLWIIKSLPVDMKKIVNSKIAVNLTTLLPVAILSGIVLSIRTENSFVGTILLFATPIIYSIFVAVLGLYVNLKFPNFTWNSEVIVVKQSISVMTTVLVGAMSIGLPAIFVFILPSIYSEYIIFFSTIIIAVITQLLYASIIKYKWDN
jgi:ABC-2 type transport system permease protein